MKDSKSRPALSYKQYYNKARQVYASSGEVVNNRTCYDANLLKLDRESTHPFVQLGDDYFDMIDTLAAEVGQRFENEAKHVFFPPGSKPKEEVMRRLKDPFSLKHVNEIGARIARQLEYHYFNCYLHTDKVYVYRNIVTDAKPHSSWLWHYDNHPTEITKIMIYLTDVTETSGPFEYLMDKNHKPVMIEPSRHGPGKWGAPKWSGSRVPKEAMDEYFANGCYTVKATGKRGTTLIFDNNTLHKANVAKSTHRDVLVYQVKPITKKMRPRIKYPDWTGSFQHKDILPEPDAIQQIIKTKW